MKSFFKYFLASVLGVLVAFLLAFLILLGIGGVMLSSLDQDVSVKDNSILTIDLSGEIADRCSDNPFDKLNFKSQPSVGLNKILKAIDNAKTDDRIRGIYIEQMGFGGGAATLEEVRNALIDFKSTGKFIVTYSDIYTQKSYYLASVADRIYINPEGDFGWTGLSAQISFYRDALDKLGLEPEIIRHGKYKSAVEPFILNRMSPENREQTLTYIGSIWNHWLQGVSESRHISVDELNRLADEMLIMDAKSSLEHRLTDALLYKDQVIDTLKMLTDTKLDKDQNQITLADYTKVSPSDKKKFSKNKIAVIYAQGDIEMSEGENNVIGLKNIPEALRKARRDSSVKAIVLRINSGGGAALAAEVIWREVDLANKTKPVVVSMGDVAASGGYYIAAPAAAIMASPTTITGSIGVFGIHMVVQKLMEKKLGIRVDMVSTNQHADMPMPLHRPYTSQERDVMQRYVEKTYGTFIGRVSQGRDITTQQVDSIGQGRVWSGANALQIKLIDKFGGLNDAIALAAEKANLSEYRVTELPELKSAMEEMMQQFGNVDMHDQLLKSLGIYKHLQSLVKDQGVQAKLPYMIDIK